MLKCAFGGRNRPKCLHGEKIVPMHFLYFEEKTQRKILNRSSSYDFFKAMISTETLISNISTKNCLNGSGGKREDGSSTFMKKAGNLGAQIKGDLSMEECHCEHSKPCTICQHKFGHLKY